MKKYISSESSVACPKCYNLMERRIWRFPKTNRHYYFSEWDVCKSCRHIQLYEKFKVYCKKESVIESQASLF